jgi:hypothetical protein
MIAPPLGSRAHPAPYKGGRPAGYARDERYSSRRLVGEVESLSARGWSALPVGAPPVQTFLGGRPILVERTRSHGAVWRCPRCARRTRTVYAADDAWACRKCANLHYPVQRVSRGLRQEARAYRSRRTLQASKEAILEARIDRALRTAEALTES